MKLDKVQISQFRNIESAIVYPSPHLNVVIGQNGSGKSSFLESLHYLGFGRSFRTNKHRHVIKSDHSQFSVFAECSDRHNDSHKIGLMRNHKDEFLCSINGERSQRLADLVAKIPVQIFTPQSTDLLLGSPSNRRKFIDWGLFHVEQDFKKEWASYIKLLKQRNEALKTRALKDDIWLEKLAEAGEQITKMRASHMANLYKHFQQNKEHILPNLELSFLYEQGWEENSSLFDSLCAKRAIDEERGYTSVGPQNANISISLNGREAQKVCSRGQQKLIANIMLLSQSKEFYERREFPSIILVDDLAAELTLDMQEKILERLFETNSQIFLTALNDSVLADILCEMDANVFHVEHGEIT